MNRMLATTLSLSAVVLAMVGSASAQITLPSTTTATTVLVAPLAFQGAEAQYNAGVTAYEKGDYAGAITAFQAAIKLRPTYTDAHFNLGVSFAAAGKLQDAVTEFTWVVTKMPPAPKGKLADSFHNRGLAYLNLGQADKAVADFEQAVTVKPEIMAQLVQDRGVAYFNMKQYDKAIADYTAYFTANAAKAEPSYYNYRGLAYLAKYADSKAEADAKAALADFDKFITADPAKNVEGYLNRGDANTAIKAFDKAILDYTAYLGKNPTDAASINAATGARARAYMETKKYAEAVGDYKKLVAANPNDATAKINLGVAQVQSGSAADAITTLSTVIGNPPKATDKLALTARASAYVTTKDWANASKDYDAILKIDPNESSAYYNRGVADLNVKAYDKAATDFQAYLKSNPKDPGPAYSGLSTAYMNLKKFPEAIDVLTKYIAANPKDTTGLYNRGAAYYNIYNTTKEKPTGLKAIDDLNAFIKSMPTDKNAVAEANKLVSYIAPDLGVDPLPSLNAAILANPKDAEPLLNRGVYYLNTAKPPQYDKAIADFTAANVLDPKDSVILYDRAMAYAGKKDFPNTIKDCTAALALKPDYTEALVARADANYNSKAYPAAIADYNQFVSLAKDPKDKAYGLIQAANASNASKDYTAAVDAMTKYIAVRPEDSNGLRLRGGYYLQAKKNDEAIKDLTDFLAKPAAPDAKEPEITSNKASGYYLRAAAYLNKEDFEKAGADFEQAFATKPEIQYATLGATAYSKAGDKLADPDPKGAATAFGKAIALYDKAVGTMAPGKPTKEVVEAYYNKAVTLEKKYKADEMIDSLKLAVEAYTQYMTLGKALTPPPTDLADVQKHIEDLKAKIAEGG